MDELFNSLRETFDAKTVFRWILITQIVELLWDYYLTLRQRRVYKKYTEMPYELIGITDKETFEKARVYALDKSSFEIVQGIFQAAFTLIILTLNGFYYMWNLGGLLVIYFGKDASENELWQTAGFVLVMMTISVVIKLPFSVYYTFVLEERHGFNKQTALFFIKDGIKSYIVSQIICIPIACGLVYIIKNGGEYFFVYLWLFVVFVTFFLLTIYPELIAPLFDKYMPLEQGDLRVEIENLAASIGFPLKKLYVVEGSKRSSHSNAYFYGFFNNKRIVLFDTLLKSSQGDEKEKGCTNNEILAVLGHELGHWKLNHVLKNIIMSQVNTFLVFFVFKTLFQHRPLYQAIGFEDSTPTLIGLLVVLQYVMQPYFAIITLVLAQVSRRFEFDADKFAKSLGRRFALKDALIKLNADNLGFPIYDPLYSAWHNSHPPLLERLQALEKDD